MTDRLFPDLARILHHPWLKREGPEAIQQVKPRKVIRHAYEYVPYYRQLFDSRGIQPEGLRTTHTTGDFASLRGRPAILSSIVSA
jgi:phenylacetate-coenzyme A ligase PaaK-like adenylate-forming protein